MKNMKRLLVLTTLVFVATVVPARAQATRTWVSGVGDDVNPCSRTAPCKTFGGTISKTAIGGVISVLDPGGFGTVTITKALTIDGGGIEGSILSSGVTGIIVNNPGGTADVTLRNLTIFGAGTGTDGIRVIGDVKGVHVEHCVISSITQDGIDFQPSSGILYVSNTKIIDATLAGIHVTSRQAFLDNVQLEGNSSGVQASFAAWVSIRHSSMTGNTFAGLFAHNGSVIDVHDSTASQNNFGFSVTFAAEIVAIGSIITGNTNRGLSNDGSGFLISTGNNFVLNNVNGTFTQTFPLQ